MAALCRGTFRTYEYRQQMLSAAAVGVRHRGQPHLEDGWVFDQRVVAQLAFNAWVAVPAQGGETSVWRRRWEPEDEVHREAYGYARSVVERTQCVTLAPELGDGLLFNPNNLHSVAPNPGQRRIAFAFFLGLTTTGQLIYWS